MEKKLREMLASKGLKATYQRIVLLEILRDHHHLDIEAIFKKVKERIPSISISTVYNNIKLLQDAGLVKEVKIPRFKTLYEVNPEDHIHLVCEKCGKIMDLPVAKETLKKNFYDFVQTEITDLEVVLFITCKECAKNGV
ncbi:Fur family transcriptional regulator, peroxide stress response regulator [Thermosulfidibacter takaii ABI70S6]|uniref:Fur family transcriptional regulator, peroxide stress response regulator n=1 Tax=Thermosulfidibacter takaii (strain DSM 17441 / JCM 13301 / NBRC 103674 / ABI70S6) TaxID=1298851 RepID=A0A0S3QTZ5_THET7|nr:Fur family transcriptional regulator [Thermosulfidibacter takaii]BAT71783.1 Fur family transcriptional regulator, peroxide stress response regulator [Thermosulfidibacter takaii ABI70S6]